MNRAAIALASISLAAGVCAAAPAGATAATAPSPVAGPVSGVAAKADVWHWKLMGTYSLLVDCQNVGVANTSTGAWDAYSCEPKWSGNNLYYLLFAGFND